MNALVVCSHLPGEGHFESERFTVAPVRCDDDYSYWQGLEQHWDGPDTLLNVEHDVGVTDAHLAALTNCPHPLCAWPYTLHWISCGRAEGCLSVAGVHGEWADWSAIGLVKIAASARTGPLRRETWQQLEIAVDEAVRGPWHLHGNGVSSGDFSGHIVHHHW